MNETVKKMWLEALTSGEYRKAREQLRTGENRMCCMGVLCDLYAKSGGEGHWEESENCRQFRTGVYSHISSVPSEVLKWAGLTTPDEISLVTLNDTKRGYPTEAIEQL